jgi:hypothetical protein
VCHARFPSGGDVVWLPDLVDTGDALGDDPFREVRNEGRLQQVTIEEHQVGDLVFALLQLFIQVVRGHIDPVIVQYDVA